MTNRKLENLVDFDSYDLISLKDALDLGLVREVSDLPKTDGSLSRLVEKLVKETTMNYADIVAEVKRQFPNANTSTKSVASVACVMRKKGIAVPLRLKLIMND